VLQQFNPAADHRRREEMTLKARFTVAEHMPLIVTDDDHCLSILYPPCQETQGRIECVRYPLRDADGWIFLASFDLGKHGAAHAGSRCKFLEGQLAAVSKRPYASAEFVCKFIVL
jgi:hypothetical protein